MNTLGQMHYDDFWTMVQRRKCNIAQIMGFEKNWELNASLWDDLFGESLTVSNPQFPNVFELFDETNAAIGEDWLWSGNNYYFVREQDAVWFRLRWE